MLPNLRSLEIRNTLHYDAFPTTNAIWQSPKKASRNPTIFNAGGQCVETKIEALLFSPVAHLQVTPIRMTWMHSAAPHHFQNTPNSQETDCFHHNS